MLVVQDRQIRCSNKLLTSVRQHDDLLKDKTLPSSSSQSFVRGLSRSHSLSSSELSSELSLSLSSSVLSLSFPSSMLSVPSISFAVSSVVLASESLLWILPIRLDSSKFGFNFESPIEFPALSLQQFPFGVSPDSAERSATSGRPSTWNCFWRLIVESSDDCASNLWRLPLSLFSNASWCFRLASSGTDASLSGCICNASSSKFCGEWQLCLSDDDVTFFPSSLVQPRPVCPVSPPELWSTLGKPLFSPPRDCLLFCFRRTVPEMSSSELPSRMAGIRSCVTDKHSSGSPRPRGKRSRPFLSSERILRRFSIPPFPPLFFTQCSAASFSWSGTPFPTPARHKGAPRFNFLLPLHVLWGVASPLPDRLSAFPRSSVRVMILRLLPRVRSTVRTSMWCVRHSCPRYFSHHVQPLKENDNM